MPRGFRSSSGNVVIPIFHQSCDGRTLQGEIGSRSTFGAQVAYGQCKISLGRIFIRGDVAFRRRHSRQVATICPLQNTALWWANGLCNSIGLLLRGLDRHRTGTALLIEVTSPSALCLFKHTAVKAPTCFLLTLLLLPHSFRCWADNYYGDRGVLQAILGHRTWQQSLHTAQISTSCSHH